MTSILILDEHVEGRDVAVSEFRKRGYKMHISADFLDLQNVLSSKLKPDIVIVRYKTTRQNSMNNIKWITDNHPSISVVVICQFINSSTLNDLKLIKVQGVVMEAFSGRGSVIYEAIKAVEDGDTYFPDM